MILGELVPPPIRPPAVVRRGDIVLVIFSISSTTSKVVQTNPASVIPIDEDEDGVVFLGRFRAFRGERGSVRFK
jgi:hypothetical protein